MFPLFYFSHIEDKFANESILYYENWRKIFSSFRRLDLTSDKGIGTKEEQSHSVSINTSVQLAWIQFRDMQNRDVPTKFDKFVQTLREILFVMLDKHQLEKPLRMKKIFRLEYRNLSQETVSHAKSISPSFSIYMNFVGQLNRTNDKFQKSRITVLYNNMHNRSQSCSFHIEIWWIG